MDVPLICFRCEKPGHGYADCPLPPAKTRQELDQRKARILIRWDAGYGLSHSVKDLLIDIEQKAHEKARANQ